MNFLLTQYGSNWFDTHPGELPEFTEFKVGDGVDYIPNPATDTDLRGSVLFAGVPGRPELMSTGEIKYLVFMDTSVGDFYWGEIGLFHNGSLFALGTTSVPVPKRKRAGQQEGNSTTIDAYLFPTSEYVVAELANSSNGMNLHVFNSLDSLPPAHQAQPNIYMVPNPTAPAKALLAFAAGGLWNLSGYEMGVNTAPIVGATASTIRLSSDIDMPTSAGGLIVAILSGPAAGLIRTAAAWDPVTRVITLSSPLQWTPMAGDLVQMSRYTAVGSLNVYRLLEDVSSNLTAEDLNQLTDLDLFFDPVLKRDGSNDMEAPLNMGANKIVNLAPPTLNNDAATKGYVDYAVTNNGVDMTVFFKRDGSVPMIGPVNMQSHRIINLGEAISGTDATTLDQVTGMIDSVLSLYMRKDGSRAMTGHLVMENHRIRLVADPVAGGDAVNFTTLTSHVLNLRGDAMLLDGSQAMQGALNVGGFRVRNVANATQLQDAVTLNDLNSRIANYFRHDGTVTMTGVFNAGGFRLTGLGAATQSSDAVNLARLTADVTAATIGLVKLDGTRPLTGNMNTAGFRVRGLPAPMELDEATNKQYVDFAVTSAVSSLSSAVMRRDGTNAMTNQLNFGGFRGVNLADPVGVQDAATKLYVDSALSTSAATLLKRDGSNAMTASLNAGTNRVINVANPTGAQDAATKSYVDATDLLLLPLSGARAMTGDLNMGTHQVKGLSAPTESGDAVSLAYLTATLGSDLSNYLRRDGTTALTGNMSLGGFLLTNAANPVSAQDVATKAYVDSATTTDLSIFLRRDGSVALTGALNANAQRVTGLPATQTHVSDAVSYAGLAAYLTGQVLLLNGTAAMVGNINANGNKVVGLATPTDAGDATSKSYVDGLEALDVRRDGSRAMTAALNMGTNKVINLATPTLGTDAVNKAYVDAAIPAALTPFVRLDGTLSMTGALNMGTTNKIINLATPTANTDAATKKYVDDQRPSFLLRDGSQSMTGALNLGTFRITNLANPTGAQDATTKTYVDSAIAGIDTSTFLKRDGSISMLGPLNMNSRVINNLSDPEFTHQAATKNYVDSALVPYLRRDGSIAMTGSFDFGSNRGLNLGTPTSNTDAATKAYVDSTVAALQALSVLRSGSQSMTGALDLGGFAISNLAAPVSETDAANKEYVDDSIAATGAGYARLDGTTPYTANLNMNTHKVVNVLDPTTAQDAATKNYVDTSITEAVATVMSIRSPETSEIVTYTLTAADASLYALTRFTKSVTDTSLLEFVELDVLEGYLPGMVFRLKNATDTAVQVTSSTVLLRLPNERLPFIIPGGIVTIYMVAADEADVTGDLAVSPPAP